MNTYCNLHSSMLQPQQVTVFPAEHMFTIVRYGLRPNASKHHIRVCACLTTQFAFFSRADSGVLLTVINAQVSDTTLSINQAAKNVAHNQAGPSSRVSSDTDDPDNCFNKLQLRWKMLRNHRDSDLYWFFEDDSVSCLFQFFLSVSVALMNPIKRQSEIAVRR